MRRGKKEGDANRIEWENEYEQKEKCTLIEAYDHADNRGKGVSVRPLFVAFLFYFFLCRQCPGDERVSFCYS